MNHKANKMKIMKKNMLLTTIFGILNLINKWMIFNSEKFNFTNLLNLMKMSKLFQYYI
jgi:hypothetical protein